MSLSELARGLYDFIIHLRACAKQPEGKFVKCDCPDGPPVLVDLSGEKDVDDLEDELELVRRTCVSNRYHPAMLAILVTLNRVSYALGGLNLVKEDENGIATFRYRHGIRRTYRRWKQRLWVAHATIVAARMLEEADAPTELHEKQQAILDAIKNSPKPLYTYDDIAQAVAQTTGLECENDGNFRAHGSRLVDRLLIRKTRHGWKLGKV